MSEYIIMPKADYVAACDAIRAKTGKTDLIKSGDLEPEILGITTGGGSSADVRYVTFMSEDGTVELGKKAVATGDDCADPIARGVFPTPTKESSVQYNYTFYGWATTPNGAADSNWNKAVTEDRTVYANFASVVRYYTVTYYDEDGTTVLKTESLAYGTMPSYLPEKDGYELTGWEPELQPVSGTTSYKAQWVARQGWSYINTVPKSAIGNGTIYSTPINNNGNLLAVSIGGSTGYTTPFVYDIESNPPTNRLTGSSGNRYWNYCDFNYNGSKLYANCNISGKGYLFTYNVSNNDAVTEQTYIQTASTASRFACSPVSSLYGYIQFISSAYKVVQSNNIQISLPAYPNCIAYSPDGKHVAVGVEGYGVRIYNVSTGSFVATVGDTSKNAKKVSYNADGSKLAISYNGALNVEVYNISDRAKICEVKDSAKAEGYAELIGQDMLVIGSGTTVLVYTVAADGLAEFTSEMPVYGGTSITMIFKNHTGTRIAFLSSNGVEIWGK